MNSDSPKTTHSREELFLFNGISNHAGYNVEMGCGVSFSQDLRQAISLLLFLI